MKNIVIVVILLAIGWKLYSRANVSTDRPAGLHAPAMESVANAPTINQLVDTAGKHFTCDGRRRCNQMSSCEEATYFQKNCPGTRMDGDGDGIPCERGPC